MSTPGNNSTPFKAKFTPKQGEVVDATGTKYNLQFDYAFTELLRRLEVSRKHLADVSDQLDHHLDNFMANAPDDQPSSFVKGDYNLIKSISVFFSLLVEEVHEGGKNG